MKTNRSQSVPTKKTTKAKTTTKAATPESEVPDWAKKAAARNTEAEMASVPETAPTPEATAEPVTAAPAAKKGRTPKAAKPAPKKTAAEDAPPVAAPGSLRALGDGWLESLRAAGHTPSTISSYGRDLEIAFDHFGDVAAADLTEPEIAAFNTSKGVTKKANGKAKAQPTILKTRRALRLALVWAEQQGLIKKAPYAVKTPA